MALALVAKIAGEEVAQAIQLGIEYDPQPPFDAGSPHKAPAAIVEAVRAYSRFDRCRLGRRVSSGVRKAAMGGGCRPRPPGRAADAIRRSE